MPDSILENDVVEARLLNEHQRDFPLVPMPYAAIGQRLGIDEPAVMAMLRRAMADGRVGRIGAVFRPGTIGVSTLAALSVPERDLARVAAAVSARPEVNHNYEREHRFNLWFVLAAADRPALERALAAIEDETGYRAISLPLLADYWIDLGFDLSEPSSFVRGHGDRRAGSPGAAPRVVLSAADRRLVAVLERGLPLVSAPYAALAERAGLAEEGVLARLAEWLALGVIKRFGVVVRHRVLGYTANAMCVWDVPDRDVDALGTDLAREAGVTLCYRRARVPSWTYNLFCMLHGRHRSAVEQRLAALTSAHRLDRYAGAVLFSRQAFKQCGARYGAEPFACAA